MLARLLFVPSKFILQNFSEKELDPLCMEKSQLMLPANISCKPVNYFDNFVSVLWPHLNYNK